MTTTIQAHWYDADGRGPDLLHLEPRPVAVEFDGRSAPALAIYLRDGNQLVLGATELIGSRIELVGREEVEQLHRAIAASLAADELATPVLPPSARVHAAPAVAAIRAWFRWFAGVAICAAMLAVAGAGVVGLVHVAQVQRERATDEVIYALRYAAAISKVGDWERWPAARLDALELCVRLDNDHWRPCARAVLAWPHVEADGGGR